MSSDEDVPNCGFALYGPPAICTCGECAARLLDALSTKEAECGELRRKLAEMHAGWSDYVTWRRSEGGVIEQQRLCISALQEQVRGLALVARRYAIAPIYKRSTVIHHCQICQAEAATPDDIEHNLSCDLRSKAALTTGGEYGSSLAADGLSLAHNETGDEHK